MPDDCFTCFICGWVVCGIDMPEFGFVLFDGFFPGYHTRYIGVASFVLQCTTVFNVAWFGSDVLHVCPPLVSIVCVPWFFSGFSL